MLVALHAQKNQGNAEIIIRKVSISSPNNVFFRFAKLTVKNMCRARPYSQTEEVEYLAQIINPLLNLVFRDQKGKENSCSFSTSVSLLVILLR